MGMATLERLAKSVETLTAALDGDDVIALERAVAAIRPVLEDMKAHGAWHIKPETTTLLKAIAPALDAARVRVNILSDLGRRRLDMLAQRGIATGPMTYGR